MPRGVYKRTIKLKSHRKNKILEEEYGEEKAKEIREKLSKSHKGYKVSDITKQKISKKNKGKTLKEIGHKPNCSCCMCKTERGEMRDENSPSWQGDIISGSTYYKRAHKVWEEKHRRIVINKKVYLLEGMHFLLNKRPIHHEDFNPKNYTSWNLIKQESKKEHIMKHAQNEKFQKFISDLDKQLEGLSEEEKNRIYEKIILKQEV